MNTIKAIRAFKDNYIWAIHNTTTSVMVDPGDAVPTLDFLKQKNLDLEAILITHHHWDHTNGITDLLSHYPNARCVGPDDIKQITEPVFDQSTVAINKLNLDFNVIAIPGHTLDHIAYYEKQSQILFCGDTLFSVGCGRLFEGTASQMFASLSKLKQLPKQTRVYCAHEYTLNNLQFAKLLAKTDNEYSKKISEYTQICQHKLKQGEPTLPSTIELEVSLNPFLNCHKNSIQLAAKAYAGKKLRSDEAVFRAIRAYKDKV